MIYWGLATYPGSRLNQEQARQKVQEFVDKVASERVRASHDADMLVAGSRDSGGFAKLLMGSVSSKVTHHAASPVMVIPGAAS